MLFGLVERTWELGIFDFKIKLQYKRNVPEAEFPKGRIFAIIIHQRFSLARDWSKRVTWANIPQLKLGNIRGYSPIFKTARVA